MPELTPHQKRALNYKDHISLTANAGSGKTFVLSKRFVEIALNENISLRNIAAITFTDKAAGDLYKKIASEVDDRIEAEKEPSLKYKLENIRRQLVSANISTIHSFCIDIIREHPIEANVDANFSPIDELYSAELIEHSVEETLKENIKLEDENNLVKPLVRFFGSKNKLADELKSLVENKKGIYNLKEKIYKNDEAEIADFFYESFNRLCSVTILAKKNAVIKAIAAVNNTVLANDKKSEAAPVINNLLESIDEGNALEMLSRIYEQMFTKSPARVRKQKYLAEKLRGGLEAEIDLLESALPGIADAVVPANHREIEIELARVGKVVLTLAETALQKYDEKKREGGYLDFEDILITTQEILKLAGVREKLSEKYKYLMVDEYQDTNEIQYNIFLPILEYLQKNNLFVVGDEKQSIYMFRDAELEIFERTKEEIKKQGGTKGILELPDSFRMAPQICAFTNLLFSRLFKEGNPVYNEVRPKDIVCGRNDGKKGAVEFIINPLDSESGKPADTLDELVALRIKKLVDDKSSGIDINYNNIAVLCRKRKSFPELEKALTRHNIPYTILGGKGFYQKQLVKDFYNYFAFLLNHENETALAGILRSPFFALDDSVLYLISREEGESYWEKTKNYANKNSKLQKAYRQIEKNLKLKTALDVASLFRKILAETNFIAVLAAQKNNEVEFENLNKLINLSIDFFNEGFKTLYDYVEFLKESIKSFEDEGQAEPVVNDDVVKIMTIHQSKGLEFDAVFLYKCGEKTMKNMVKSKSIFVDKNFGLLTKVPLDNKYFEDYYAAPIVKLANHITSKKEAAEMKRLFYVAVTRAKTYLFVTSDYKESGFDEDSMMGQLQSALNIDFTKESYSFNHELTYLLSNSAGYYNEKKKIEFEIPITTSIDYTIASEEIICGEPVLLKNMTGVVIDMPENEIFSATKISTYMQCPLKYKLNYEFNFNSMFNDYLEWQQGTPFRAYSGARHDEIETSKIPELTEEEDRNIYPEVKGRVIHSVLQNEIKGEGLQSFIKEKLSQDIFLDIQNPVEVDAMIRKIGKEITVFYESETYKELASSSESYNEFELFIKENDYILHGIIDKLVVDKNEYTIIDYKTDEIEEDKLKESFNSYLSQLKFYSYIVYKHFKNLSKLKVKVIFIKHPALDFSEVIDKASLTVLGNEYKTIINNIRNRVFDKNTGHCRNCIYWRINHKCIVD